MAIFHFPQYEHELFCWYFKRLNAFLPQCEYYMGKWEILGIVDERVNSEIQILLQFSDFHRFKVDDAWSLLLWVAWDSFEFEKACCVYRYSFPDPCAFYARSYYAPCGVTCVILLPIMLAHVLIMLVMPCDAPDLVRSEPS